MTIDLTLPKNPKAEDLIPILTSLRDQLAALEERVIELEHPRRFSPRENS